MWVSDDQQAFATFVDEVEPRLRRAFTLLRGPEDGRDATAEALGWAWEHWADVQAMDNPAGYLYRVGASRTRPRPTRLVQIPSATTEHGYEPQLVPALARSSVGTHVERAMTQLRTEPGVDHHG